MDDVAGCDRSSLPDAATALHNVAPPSAVAEHGLVQSCCVARADMTFRMLGKGFAPAFPLGAPGSIRLSLVLQMAAREKKANFIGQWGAHNSMPLTQRARVATSANVRPGDVANRPVHYQEP
jgi:hypothetical protein